MVYYNHRAVVWKAATRSVNWSWTCRSAYRSRPATSMAVVKNEKVDRAGRVITHFIQRYGNPRYADDLYKPFAKLFSTHYAVGLLTNKSLRNRQVKLMCGLMCKVKMATLSSPDITLFIAWDTTSLSIACIHRWRTRGSFCLVGEHLQWWRRWRRWRLILMIFKMVTLLITNIL